jgi:hypothetical protein
MRRNRDRRGNEHMRIRSRNRNDTRVVCLGRGRFLNGWSRGRNCGPKLGLQFADGTLQFCVLFGVLFDEFGQLLLEVGIPKKEPNRQERCG